MGYVLDKQGNYEDALAAFNRAMELAPDNEKYLASRNAVQSTWSEFQKVFDVQVPSNAAATTTAMTTTTSPSTTTTNSTHNTSPTLSRDSVSPSLTHATSTSSSRHRSPSMTRSRTDMAPKEDVEAYYTSDAEVNSSRGGGGGGGGGALEGSLEFRSSSSADASDFNGSLNIIRQNTKSPKRATIMPHTLHTGSAISSPSKTSPTATISTTTETNSSSTTPPPTGKQAEVTFNPFLSFEASSPGAPLLADHSPSPLSITSIVLPGDVILMDDTPETLSILQTIRTDDSAVIEASSRPTTPPPLPSDLNSALSSLSSSASSSAHHLVMALAPIAHAGLPPSPGNRGRMLNSMSSSAGVSDLIIPNTSAIPNALTMSNHSSPSPPPAQTIEPEPEFGVSLRSESPMPSSTLSPSNGEPNTATIASTSTADSVGTASNASNTSGDRLLTPPSSSSHSPIPTPSTSSFPSSSVRNAANQGSGDDGGNASTNTTTQGHPIGGNPFGQEDTSMAIIMPPLNKDQVAIGVEGARVSMDEAYLQYAFVPSNTSPRHSATTTSPSTANTDTTTQSQSTRTQGLLGRRNSIGSSSTPLSSLPPHLAGNPTSSSSSPSLASNGSPTGHSEEGTAKIGGAPSIPTPQSASTLRITSNVANGSVGKSGSGYQPMRGSSGVALPQHSESSHELRSHHHQTHSFPPNHTSHASQGSTSHVHGMEKQTTSSDVSPTSHLSHSDAASLLNVFQSHHASQQLSGQQPSQQQQQGMSTLSSSLQQASSSSASSSSSSNATSSTINSGSMAVPSPDGSDNEYENRVHVGPRLRTYLEALYTHLQGIKTSREAEKIETALEEMLEAVRFKRSFLAAKESSQQQPDEKCACCWEKPPEMVCIPCGHLCICEECKSKLRQKKCPICSQPVKNIYKVFK